MEDYENIKMQWYSQLVSKMLEEEAPDLWLLYRWISKGFPTVVTP